METRRQQSRKSRSAAFGSILPSQPRRKRENTHAAIALSRGTTQASVRMRRNRLRFPSIEERFFAINAPDVEQRRSRSETARRAKTGTGAARADLEEVCTSSVATAP